MAVENFDASNDKSSAQVSEISVFAAGVGGSINQAINEWREASANRTASSTPLNDFKLTGLDATGSEKGICAPTPQPNRAAFDARPEDTNKVREQDYKNDLSQKRSVTGDELKDTSGPKNRIPEDHRINEPTLRHATEKGIVAPTPVPLRASLEGDKKSPRLDGIQNDFGNKRSVSPEELKKVDGPVNKVPKDVLDRLFPPPVKYAAGD